MISNTIQQQEEFFRPFFPSESELKSFIKEIWEYQDDLSPRRMLNNVHRLVTLADDMDKIRPDRRDLSIFFIVCCIESLYKYVPGNRIKKQEMVINFFQDFLSPNDRKRIEEGIEYSYENKDGDVVSSSEITIEEFALLLTSIRNEVAHEGNYWSFSFNEDDCPIISRVVSKLQKDCRKMEIAYTVAISYRHFREICIRTFISFLRVQFDHLKQLDQ